MGRRAFTLIELLVVIAIIAILAAVIFPVFALAKESAYVTTTLSNFKQSSLGMMQYTVDHDDTMPQAWGWNTATGKYRMNAWTATPAGWLRNGIHDVEPRKSEESMLWANSIQPYAKSTAIYEMSRKIITNLSTPPVRNTEPALVGMTFNGLLHNYPASAIAAPSNLPVLWPGVFAQNVRGFSMSNPFLRCEGLAPCRFNPTGMSQADAKPAKKGYGISIRNDQTYKAWIYKTGMHFAYADGSAKFVDLKLPTWPKFTTDIRRSPFTALDPQEAGRPYQTPDCTAVGTKFESVPLYPGFFRPDSTFDWTTEECDFGQRSGGQP